MGFELLLSIKSTTEKMKIVKLNSIDSSDKVKKLRTETAEHTKLPSDTFEMLYCGNILDNECTLESYGVKNGSVVHVIKKVETKKPVFENIKKTNTQANEEQLTSIFKSFISNPLLELAMRRLMKRPEVIENIISTTPGLSEDAVAIALLQDPDLMIHFTNTETIKRIAQLHPALLEAAQHISSAVHEEAHNFAASSTSLNASSVSNTQTTGHSYSLDNLSDDEEMAGESSQSSDSTQHSNSTNQTRNQSSSLASAAQLFAAFSRARRSTSAGGSNMGNSSSPLSSTPRNNLNSGGVITFQMFNEAMQQAFASSPIASDQGNFSQPPLPTASFSTTSPNPIQPNDMERHIRTMHDMGLENDAINMQALRATNGDVSAAIDLVLNEFGQP